MTPRARARLIGVASTVDFAGHATRRAVRALIFDVKPAGYDAVAKTTQTIRRTQSATVVAVGGLVAAALAAVVAGLPLAIAVTAGVIAGIGPTIAFLAVHRRSAR